MADETPDPKASFAQLMSGAADLVAPAADAEAPYGYTTDPDGTRRPKKTAGRPRKSRSLDELKAAAAEPPPPDAPAATPPGDRAPARPKGSRRRTAPPAGAVAEGAAGGYPQHRPGVITKGVNRLYKKAGKIVRVMDADIGSAILASTENTAEEGEPDDSVGAAWDEVARTNPRIRAFLLRAVAGGAWGALVMAHGPILMALIMKDSIRRWIPFMKLIEAAAAPDDEDHADGQPGAPVSLFAGLQPADMQQMMNLAQDFMLRQAAAAPGQPVPPPPTADGPEGERHGRVA